MLGLHARDHAERGEPGDVLVRQQLSVLDGSGEPVGVAVRAPELAVEVRERVEREPVRVVADGVDRGAEALPRGPHHELPQLLRRDGELAARAAVRVAALAVEVGVRVEAVRGAGVEGSVGDDLRGSHAHEPAGAREHVARAEPLVARPVEVLRPDADLHAERVVAEGGESAPASRIPVDL